MAGMDWTDLAHDRDMWLAIANMENLWVQQNFESLLVSQGNISFSRRTLLHEVKKSVSQLATYHLIFSFFSLYLLKKSCSCVHTSTEHSPCFAP